MSELAGGGGAGQPAAHVTDLSPLQVGPVELEQPEAHSAPALVLSHGSLQPSQQPAPQPALQPAATGAAGAVAGAGAAAAAGAAGAARWANASLPLHLRYASPTSDGSSFRAFTLPPPLLFVGCAAVSDADAADAAADADADAADAAADADADSDGARLPPAGCPPLALIGKAWVDVCAPAAPPPVPRRLGGHGPALTWHAAALAPDVDGRGGGVGPGGAVERRGGAGVVDPRDVAGSNGDGDDGNGARGGHAAEEGTIGATPLAGGLLALVPVGQVRK